MATSALFFILSFNFIFHKGDERNLHAGTPCLIYTQVPHVCAAHAQSAHVHVAVVGNTGRVAQRIPAVLPNERRVRHIINTVTGLGPMVSTGQQRSARMRVSTHAGQHTHKQIMGVACCAGTRDVRCTHLERKTQHKSRWPAKLETPTVTLRHHEVPACIVDKLSSDVTAHGENVVLFDGTDHSVGGDITSDKCGSRTSGHSKRSPTPAWRTRSM